MAQTRTDEFKRNESLEHLLTELNGALAAAERGVGPLPDQPPFPTILIVGAPRSGTTLLMQWLASSGLVAYPSNLLSRFYAAPYIGARIQQLFTDPRFNFRGELGELTAQPMTFQSELGKTQGALQPNEFWYFWRRFLPNVDAEWLDPERAAQVDAAGLRSGIAHIQHAFGMPFAAKGIILQYNLELLRHALGRVLFVHTRRNPYFNTQSLLDARVRFHGSIDAWFSVKPPEYEELLRRDPVTQAAGQVVCTQQRIEEQFAAMPAEHHLTVDHGRFCTDPAGVFHAIGAKMKALGAAWPDAYTGPPAFQENAAVTVDASMREAILKACSEFGGAEPRI